MFRNALQPWHLLVVAIVVIVLFGSKRLPDTARALGKSLRILKSETKAMKEEDSPQTAAPSPDGTGQQARHPVQATPGDAPLTSPTSGDHTAPR
ncbi:Sec-independent protein translocase subunit TatA [Streptomyces mutabilis]|uniref:Sec-independent protein translocase subunit TatA n=1 Tax=Streptomyces mutabilis TaxID=67332 RepID=UPI0036BE1691